MIKCAGVNSELLDQITHICSLAIAIVVRTMYKNIYTLTLCMLFFSSTIFNEIHFRTIVRVSNGLASDQVRRLMRCLTRVFIVCLQTVLLKFKGKNTTSTPKIGSGLTLLIRVGKSIRLNTQLQDFWKGGSFE